MPGIQERNKQKLELASVCYSIKYIDEWPAKTTLYRHKSDTAEGKGAAIPNLPGNPDFVLSKARSGLFPWPPSETCTCRWCATDKPVAKKETKPVVAVDDPTVITV